MSNTISRSSTNPKGRTEQTERTTLRSEQGHLETTESAGTNGAKLCRNSRTRRAEKTVSKQPNKESGEVYWSPKVCVWCGVVWEVRKTSTKEERTKLRKKEQQTITQRGSRSSRSSQPDNRTSLASHRVHACACVCVCVSMYKSSEKRKNERERK